MDDFAERIFSDRDDSKKSNYQLNFNNVYDEEEKDNFIYSIREKIMSNVMKEIDRIDLTSRTISFIVDIGCEALWRMLNIEFIQHTALPNLNSAAWKGDICLEPSGRDTLAANSIPITPKSKETKEYPEFLPKFVCECQLGAHCECMIPPQRRNKQKPRENCVKNCTKHVKEDCKCDLGVACECLFPPLRRDQVAMKLLDEPTIIEAPLLVEEEHVSLVEEEQVELTYESNPKISSSIYDEASRSMSSFAPSDSSSNDEREGMKCVLSEGFSKLQSKKKQESLPKLNVTHPTRAVSVSTLMELPEIRTPVRTDYRSVEPEIKPKKKFG